MKRLIAILFLVLVPISLHASVGLLQFAAPPIACVFTRGDFTTGSLPAGFTETRAGTNATFVNVSGVLTTAGANVARFNYDANYPHGGAPSLTGPYLLVEPAATNLALQSNTFSNATWSQGGGGLLTAAAATSPDGTVDASNWHTNAGSFASIQQSLNLSAVTTTLSAWTQQNTSTTVLLLFQAAHLGSNINTGASWVRNTFSLTPTTGANNVGIGYNTASAGDAFIFGYQIELGSVATSYITTTTGSATRNADSIAFTQPAGCGHNTYTFDDSSTQVVVQAPGAATIPTTLNRPNIKFIDGSA